MAVRNPQTVDTIARSADGVVVLATTEDRPYPPESTPSLVEELRGKLNTNIYAVSGPPEEALEVLRFAGHVLAEDGVAVNWKKIGGSRTSPPGHSSR